MLAQQRRPAPEAGFTILEVLVAFMVFAVAFGALMQVFSGGLREAQVADEYARASQVAQSRLAGVTAAERIEESSTAGTEDGFAWSLAVTPYDEREEYTDADRTKEYSLRVRLLKVESVVAWHASDGRDRNVRLATLLLVGKQ
ncbi:MAG: prepilin-type N-terminal cleavage/methylation domain-containing protein [Betaproteobacteria bacterium]|nr:prepilin-type N-terminal cleavage/methylation domain-containing protein [Betaproteobacteria bacterium]